MQRTLVQCQVAYLCSSALGKSRNRSIGISENVQVACKYMRDDRHAARWIICVVVTGFTTAVTLAITTRNLSDRATGCIRWDEDARCKEGREPRIPWSLWMRARARLLRLSLSRWAKNEIWATIWADIVHRHNMLHSCIFSLIHCGSTIHTHVQFVPKAQRCLWEWRMCRICLELGAFKEFALLTVWWKGRIIREPKFLYFTLSILCHFLTYVIFEKFCNCFFSFFFFFNATAHLRGIPTCIICRNVPRDAFLRRKGKKKERYMVIHQLILAPALCSSYLSR